MSKLWRDFLRHPWQVRFTTPLIAINILGSFYGYYWYREQLATTSLCFWPFVPDSPLSAILFALALALRGDGTGRVLFQLVAFTATIKYGIWAVIIISQYWITGGPVEFTEMMLFLSHLGMAIQGAIYLKVMQPSSALIAITGTWMLLNDLMDYGVGLHPHLFAARQEDLALGVALGLTLTLTAGLELRKKFFTAKQALD